LREVEPLITLQANEVGAENAAHDLCQLRLSDARRTLDQQRAAELSRQKHADAQRVIGDVVVLGERLPKAIDRVERPERARCRRALTGI
jgi:hypothetical protein